MKQNNNKHMPALLAIAILGVLVISGCSTINNNAPRESTISPSGKGRFVVTMADAAADMGSVSEVRMTVDSIEANSKTKGWVTLGSEQRTYNLLELKSQNKAELMADSEVNADEFNQIRFNIKEVVVVDSKGEHKAKVPSSQYKVNIDSKVEADQTSTAEFDIIADQSLHVTGNGEYIMAPVAKVETKSNANVQVNSDNSVAVIGGETTLKTIVGMDVSGAVGVGLKIPADAKLEVNTGAIGSGVSISTGSVSVGNNGGNNGMQVNGKGKLILGITDVAADMGSVSEVKITVDEVQAHSNTDGWITLSTTDKQYELLKLKSEGKVELVLDTEIDSGQYDQIRMDVKNVIVVDSKGEHEAKLPSGEIRIIDNFSVESSSATAVTFDFKVDESLHVTGEGSYIMAPVINVETRERASVSFQNENGITVQGGEKSEVTVGMDINGNVGVGKRISSTANLKLNTSGTLGLD